MMMAEGVAGVRRRPRAPVQEAEASETLRDDLARRTRNNSDTSNGNPSNSSRISRLSHWYCVVSAVGAILAIITAQQQPSSAITNTGAVEPSARSSVFFDKTDTVVTEAATGSAPTTSLSLWQASSLSSTDPDSDSSSSWLDWLFSTSSCAADDSSAIIEDSSATEVQEKEQAQFQLPGWLRWLTPPEADDKEKHASIQEQKSSTQNVGAPQQEQQQSPSSSFPFWFSSSSSSSSTQTFDGKNGFVLDPTLLRPSASTFTDLIDKILTSTPRLLVISNVLLVGTYLLHAAVANFFLGSASGMGGGGFARLGAGDGLALGGGGSTSMAARDQRLGGFLVFKLLLISAVVAPDTLDLLILLSWYTLLSFLRSLAFLCANVTQHTSQSGQAPRPGVLQLLTVVFFSNILAAAVCVALFHGAGWGMVLLLTCDNALLMVDVIMHMLQHSAQVWEVQHGEQVSALENQQIRLHRRLREQEGQSLQAESTETQVETESESEIIVDSTDSSEQAHGNDIDIACPESEDGHYDRSSESNLQTNDAAISDADADADLDRLDTRELDRCMEVLEQHHLAHLSVLDTAVFGLQLLTHALTVCHFLHIWSLHGVQFTLIDGVLALHLHSALSSASKKISERRNLNRIARDLDGMFENASELDLRKAAASGDVCCICLGGMSTGNVKKVGCGHLYHTACLREVVERARSMEAARCPLCRASVTDGRQPGNAHNRTHQQQRGSNIPNRDVIAGARGDAAMAGTLPNDINIANNATGGNVGFNHQRERALFRFSSEEVFPAWLPLPAFSFEVVRRPSAAQEAAENEIRNNVNNMNRAALVQQAMQQQGAINSNNAATTRQQQSFLRRLLLLTGTIPMSPEEEVAALNQLVDMFPQYDRSDLLRELRDRGSSGAVAESILSGSFSGVPRGAASLVEDATVVWGNNSNEDASVEDAH